MCRWDAQLAVPWRRGHIIMTRVTEKNNPATRDLDLRSTEDILRIINAEDQGSLRRPRHHC